MTGLAAAVASGFPCYEADEQPGGICSSYYMRPFSSEHLSAAPRDGEAYHFEIGGGHWIFGGEPCVLHYIDRLTPVRSYLRKSGVYFPNERLSVAYPIQNHVSFLNQETRVKVLTEILSAATSHQPARTMAEWVRSTFGQTLCEIFFDPFHDLYTAGLYREIAPQDAYKTPVDLSLLIKGAMGDVPPVGYNAQFAYPKEGLHTLAQRMAERGKIHFGKRVVHIDVKRKLVGFADNSEKHYRILISSLPLNKMMALANLSTESKPDPSSSVLVVNIGGIKGSRCPDDHWVYIPQSRAGFHRVGIYSNVDRSFLPTSSQARNDRVSIYVEKALKEGQKPREQETQSLGQAIIKELQEWEFLGESEVMDPTWIDVAYTWSWPGSRWRLAALKILLEHDIYQVGRYAGWVFQGIADSIRDGFLMGTAMRNS